MFSVTFKVLFQRDKNTVFTFRTTLEKQIKINLNEIFIFPKSRGATAEGRTWLRSRRLPPRFRMHALLCGRSFVTASLLSQSPASSVGHAHSPVPILRSAQVSPLCHPSPACSVFPSSHLWSIVGSHPEGASLYVCCRVSILNYFKIKIRFLSCLLFLPPQRQISPELLNKAACSFMSRCSLLETLQSSLAQEDDVIFDLLIDFQQVKTKRHTACL